MQQIAAPDEDEGPPNQGRLWSAPELRVSDQHTRAADVFAYGTLLYELISRKDPSIAPPPRDPSQPAPAIKKLVCTNYWSSFHQYLRAVLVPNLLTVYKVTLCCVRLCCVALGYVMLR